MSVQGAQLRILYMHALSTKLAFVFPYSIALTTYQSDEECICLVVSGSVNRQQELQVEE
jgi:hypothetical protein